MIERGDIYWVDHSGAAGAEIRKTRPAVVVSNDFHNATMGTVTVAPFSSGKASRFEVDVPSGAVGDGRACRIKTHQLRAVDKSRLGRKVGELPEALMRSLDRSLRSHLGLDRPPGRDARLPHLLD